MKTLNIVLLGLIIVGVGLLLTQKFWVPGLVSFILEHEQPGQKSTNYGVTAEIPTPTLVPQNEMSNWNWVVSDVSNQGTQFSYPNPLPTTYITPQDWPPVVTMTAEAFSCEEENPPITNELSMQYETRTINGSLYCVAVSREGAAGSTYTSYEYSTTQGDFLTTVSFTLRTPQCMNYDEPEQSACVSEQAAFNVDELAERIVSSLTMQ